MSSAFQLVKKTFSTYRQFKPEGKLARTGTAMEVSGGMMILTADWSIAVIFPEFGFVLKSLIPLVGRLG